MAGRRIQPVRACRQQQRRQQQQRPPCAMTLGQMKAHLRENADENGNLWCHQEGCRGTYTPYRVNTWGLRKTGTNKEEGREMVDQQVTNILRHLEKVHNIPKHEVTEDVLPKKTPPFPELLELGSSSEEQEEAAALKEEVAHLKERVAYLERDVEGLEAIVENLADRERRIARQLWRLWYDSRHNRPFHPSHDEDEFPSITGIRRTLKKREDRVWAIAEGDEEPPEWSDEEEEEEESLSHENSDSEVECVGVTYHSSGPACYSEDEGTALEGKEEEEEEEQQPPTPPQLTSPSQLQSPSPAPPSPSTAPPSPSPAPLSPSALSNYSVQSMELTLVQQQSPSPPQPQSPSPAPLSPSPSDYSVKSMELTPPLHTTIFVRKRRLEAEEEEELEFRPLGASTPNDPGEEGPAADKNTPSKKRPRLTREEDDNISVLLSSDEEDENLAMAATPELSWRTLLWTQGARMPPRVKAPKQAPPKSAPGPSRVPPKSSPSFTLPPMTPWPDHDPTKPRGQCPSCMQTMQLMEGLLTTGNLPSHLTGLPY